MPRYIRHTSGIPFTYVKQLMRFRTGAHHLAIETGRWARPKLPRQHRVCSKCSCTVVEDEVHFLFGCLLGYSSCLVVWIPLFLDPSDGAFGRFDLAALCGCRTLNFCLFVCLFECPAYDRIREKYNTVLFAQFGGCQEASSTMKHNFRYLFFWTKR